LPPLLASAGNVTVMEDWAPLRGFGYSAKWVLVAAVSFAGGGRLDSREQSGAMAIRAAQIELLVLRATVAGSEKLRKDLVVLAPSSRALTIDEAAEAMAALPKPVRCAAHAPENRILVVRCEPLSDDNERVLHFGNARSGQKMTDPQTPLLIRAEGGDLLVTQAAYALWSLDYYTPITLFQGFRPPTDDERLLGAQSVVEISRIEPVDLDTVPPDVLPPSLRR